MLRVPLLVLLQELVLPPAQPLLLTNKQCEYAHIISSPPPPLFIFFCLFYYYWAWDSLLSKKNLTRKTQSYKKKKKKKDGEIKKMLRKNEEARARTQGRLGNTKDQP
jgi:hypothetical protein